MKELLPLAPSTPLPPQGPLPHAFAFALGLQRTLPRCATGPDRTLGEALEPATSCTATGSLGHWLSNLLGSLMPLPPHALAPQCPFFSTPLPPCTSMHLPPKCISLATKLRLRPTDMPTAERHDQWRAMPMVQKEAFAQQARAARAREDRRTLLRLASFGHQHIVIGL